jgi:hypothetical protein
MITHGVTRELTPNSPLYCTCRHTSTFLSLILYLITKIKSPSIESYSATQTRPVFLLLNVNKRTLRPSWVELRALNIHWITTNQAHAVLFKCLVKKYAGCYSVPLQTQDTRAYVPTRSARVRWCLTFAGVQYETWFTSPFWRLDSWNICAHLGSAPSTHRSIHVISHLQHTRQLYKPASCIL